jgi:hypothetical protein
MKLLSQDIGFLGFSQICDGLVWEGVEGEAELRKNKD